MGAISFSKEAKDKLMGYHYPGNVRELKMVIELAAVMCEENEIKPDDITFSPVKKDSLFTSGQKTLRQHTCDIIKYYLKQNDNDVIATAEKLDIGKSTIYKMMKDGEI